MKKGITAINPGEGTDQVKFVETFTNGIGADGVVITASSKSNDIIAQSAQMCRKLGRVILVGVIGLDISRADFYNKEITFQVSCSYGPGRYDEAYEQKGNDYPIGYVRWTEKRNFEAVLKAISNGALDVKPLITQRIPLLEYDKIYGDMGASKSIASILEYNDTKAPISTVTINDKSFTGNKGVIGIVGAGNFTSATILPNLKKLNAAIKYIASSGGLSSTTMAKQYNIANSTTNYKEILSDTDTDLVLITTKHNMHATMVLEVFEGRQKCFCRKTIGVVNRRFG